MLDKFLNCVVALAVLGYVEVAVEVCAGPFRNNKGMTRWQKVIVVVGSALWPCAVCWLLMTKGKLEKTDGD